MKTNTSKLIALFTSVAFLVCLLLSAIDFISFDRDFYPKEYAKYNNAEIIGISSEELMKATHVLLDYIQGKRADMVVTATIQGTQREVFNQRETDHMVDVRNLYLNAMLVRNVCGILALLGLAILVIKSRKSLLYNLTLGYIRGCGLFTAVFLGVGFFAYTDFNRFWTLFHQLFFTNDLWLLDPTTDIMIMMVPEGFFYDLVFKIAGTFLILAVLLLVAAIAYRYLKAKKMIQEEIS